MLIDYSEVTEGIRRWDRFVYRVVWLGLVFWLRGILGTMLCQVGVKD